MYQKGNLVVYKTKLAVVKTTAKTSSSGGGSRKSERIAIDIEDGTEARVRAKDITMLHPGPIRHIADLKAPQDGELEEAWDILEGQTTTIAELAELAFGEFSAASASSVWYQVRSGELFIGEPKKITALTREERSKKTKERQAREKATERRKQALERLKQGNLLPEDRPVIADIEALALGKSDSSATLRKLGIKESPENAHELLYKKGVWNESRNPHPHRLGVETAELTLDVPPLPDEERTDLTQLEAFAIDDEGASTPDDALSFDDGSIWVHIADPAALISPDDDLDRVACNRGVTLHMPEGAAHMLPEALIRKIGLGLDTRSPSLSFKIYLTDEGPAEIAEVIPSWTQVTRKTYQEVDECLESTPFREIPELTRRYRSQREERGAVNFTLPEARISVDHDGKVCFLPMPSLASRSMVQEAMIMTGEAVARWAWTRQLAIPYTAQPAPDSSLERGAIPSLSELWALRRGMKRSVKTTTPSGHAALGLALYTQATSPLRRYLDLLVHFQIRATLAGREPMETGEITRRMGEADAAAPLVRKAEWLSNRHWTVVYFIQNPDWEGEAVVVEKRSKACSIIIPELAFVGEVFPQTDVHLDTKLRVKVEKTDLPRLTVHFTVIG